MTIGIGRRVPIIEVPELRQVLLAVRTFFNFITSDLVHFATTVATSVVDGTIPHVLVLFSSKAHTLALNHCYVPLNVSISLTPEYQSWPLFATLFIAVTY